MAGRLIDHRMMSAKPRKMAAAFGASRKEESAPLHVMGRATATFTFLIAALLASGELAWPQARVEAIRFWSFGDITRVAIQTRGDYRLATDQIQNPDRAYFDLDGLRPPESRQKGVQTIAVNDKRLKQIRVAEISPGKTRVVFDLEGPVEIVSSQLVNPDRLMVELRPKGTGKAAALSIAPSTTGSSKIDLSKSAPESAAIAGAAVEGIPTPATLPARMHPENEPAKQEHGGVTPPPQPLEIPQPTQTASKARGGGVPSPALRTGNDSLVRIFGLKLGKVVIDAGHGGHDTGTIGPGGLMEKDLVLETALRLGKLITEKLSAKVVYTRSDDTFIPLEERTRLANAEKADLFISIHANSSPEPSATGVETYFFNFTSDRGSLDLATRENATSTSSISDLNDLLRKAVLKAKLAESREFAQKVQANLWASSVKLNSRSKDRGVREAPFVVLIGANMPSVLAEIGFVSNPHDERLLEKSDARQKIAEALYKGVSEYAKTLSHTEVASSN